MPFREDAPLGIPASPYGATKRAAEILGLTYHQLFGVPVVCLRPFSVYGPRLRPDLAMSIFTGKIDRGEPLPLYGDGSIRRDFTHVQDICAGLAAALSADDVVGQEINLGHSHPIAMRALIGMLESALGKKALIDHARPATKTCPSPLPTWKKPLACWATSRKYPWRPAFPSSWTGIVNGTAGRELRFKVGRHVLRIAVPRP